MYNIDFDARSSDIIKISSEKEVEFMELIKITVLTNQLSISSRILRYYEQMGLIQSVRQQFEKYCFYDSENIERIKQIIVIRKMQIQ